VHPAMTNEKPFLSISKEQSNPVPAKAGTAISRIKDCVAFLSEKFAITDEYAEFM